ncbi:hypothetical protein [Olleya sp. YS]|uniref:hypothetical protein n=1 Tax=Olleya sp. YS TaxID=3028318 RepID=UPI0024344A43|nr:hypothetical protein [Olleya sp. YS]WGD35250.1 hypothetical protein Ollyesu_02300 [Olleya sp. YS]
MKLKPTFIIAFCLLLTACACDNDEDNIKTVALTETNYVYEGDLYIYALETERQNLFDYLENPNDPNYNEEQAAIAEQRIGEINEIIESSTTGAMIGFPIIPPPPLPPVPCICFSVWNQLEFLVLDDSILAIEATITDQNQEVLFYANSQSEMLNVLEFQDGFKAFRFEAQQEGYFGPATLTINKVDQSETPISYSVPLLIGDAQ